jgi:phage terminase large subunit GpA-like protein
VASCRAAPVAGPSFVDATERGRKIRRGARLWTVAVATFKSETYRYLRLAVPTDEDIAAGATAPPGFIHLPRGAEAEWIKQLVAEQLVTVTTRRGFQKLEWQKLRERNEVLDCRVYARAAAWIAGADRWPGAKWRGLEDQLGPAHGHRNSSLPLPQRNCKPAHVEICNQADLSAFQLQDGALVVGKLDQPCANPHRGAGPGGDIDSGDVRRPANVDDPANQGRLRQTED